MDWNSIKTFVGGMLLRWVLKISAGVVATLGIKNESWEEVVGAVILFGVGALISLIQHKKAINTPVPK